MNPMLSATAEDIKTLRYPLLCSPKLDGIRALVISGKLVSRNLKPIRNLFVSRMLPLAKMEGWDGELIVGKPTAADVFNATTRGVMSTDGTPDFKFHVFDYIPKGDIPYKDRLKGLRANIEALKCAHVTWVYHTLIESAFDLKTYEETMLQRGYEGVMLRSPDGKYKHGRATLKEGYLMKLKRFEDSEAMVLDIVEQMENTNVKTVDALGKAKRSSHKAGKIAKGTMGALVVADVHTGVQFELGTGFDDAFRRAVWDNPKLILKKMVKYKFQPTGVKEKPRFPGFLGIRED